KFALAIRENYELSHFSVVSKEEKRSTSAPGVRDSIAPRESAAPLLTPKSSN
ncbi:hypothetical protein HDU99_003912, partial [Rhizoclosmatium hyalinum]